MKWVREMYVAFTDDTVLEGAAPQERFLEGQTRAPIPAETLVDPITKELEGTQAPEVGVPPLHKKWRSPPKSWPPQRCLQKRWPPQRSPPRNQLLQWLQSASQLRSQISPCVA